MRYLTFALTKGRLASKTLEMLERLGITCDEMKDKESRKLIFTNEELTDEQKSLIDWYKNVFRPEDLRLVESVQKGLHSRGYRGQGRIMADDSSSGISEHGIAFFHNLVAQRYNQG